MYLMIDNFDSFVYNLKAYFEEMGRCVTVKRCDRISLHDVEDLEPEGIILSPGRQKIKSSLTLSKKAGGHNTFTGTWAAMGGKNVCGCCEHV